MLLGGEPEASEAFRWNVCAAICCARMVLTSELSTQSYSRPANFKGLHANLHPPCKFAPTVWSRYGQKAGRRSSSVTSPGFGQPNRRGGLSDSSTSWSTRNRGTYQRSGVEGGIQTDCLSVGVHLYGGTALPTCVTRQDCLKEEVPFEQLGASGSNRDYRHRSSFDSPYVRVQLKRGHLSYPLPTYYRLPVRGTCLLETCVMRALAIHVLEGGIDVWRHAGLCPRRQGTLKTSWPT